MTYPRPSCNERLSSLVLSLLGAFCAFWLGARHADDLYVLIYSPPKEWIVYSVTFIPNRIFVIQCSAMSLSVGLVLLTLAWWKRSTRYSSVGMELWRWSLNIVASLLIMLAIMGTVGKPLNSFSAWVVFGGGALAIFLDMWRKRTEKKSNDPKKVK